MVKCVSTKSFILFEVNERRGNLPSLTSPEEVFNGCKTTRLRTQSREIASGIQQRLAESAFTKSLPEPRNDEWLYKRV
jgi:hypothetical protein